MKQKNNSVIGKLNNELRLVLTDDEKKPYVYSYNKEYISQQREAKDVWINQKAIKEILKEAGVEFRKRAEIICEDIENFLLVGELKDTISEEIIEGRFIKEKDMKKIITKLLGDFDEVYGT